MEIDPATLDLAAAYRLLISAIVPRPIAWIGSRDPLGVDNLAPFSYFMGVSSEPPMLAVSIARARGGVLKHTAANLLATREFSVSAVEEPDLLTMHRTSAPWPGSEFEAVGVEKVPCSKIAASRPASARVSLECRLAHALDLGQCHLFVGEIVAFHVADELWREGAVDIAGYRPVARLGGEDYATLGALVTLPRARL